MSPRLFISKIGFEVLSHEVPLVSVLQQLFYGGWVFLGKVLPIFFFSSSKFMPHPRFPPNSALGWKIRPPMKLVRPAKLVRKTMWLEMPIAWLNDLALVGKLNLMCINSKAMMALRFPSITFILESCFSIWLNSTLWLSLELETTTKFRSHWLHFGKGMYDWCWSLPRVFWANSNTHGRTFLLFQLRAFFLHRWIL